MSWLVRSVHHLGRTRVALSWITLVALLATACTSAAPQPAPQPAASKPKENVKVRIAQPIVTMALSSLYVAKNKGFFAEEGIDAEIITASGGGTETQAVMSKDVEFGATAGSELLKTHSAGNPLLGVMNLYNRLSINLVMSKKFADSKNITSKSPLADKVKALKGTNIGITRAGALTDVLARYYVLKGGYDPTKDAQIISVGTASAALAAVEQGKIDVFTFGPPNSDEAVIRGIGMLLVNILEGEDPDLADFLMQVLVVRPEYAKENPETVKKVVRALSKANKWLRESPLDQVAPVVQPQFSALSQESLTLALKAMQGGFVPDGAFSEKGIITNYEIMEKTGFATTRTPVDKMVTAEFTKR